MTAKAHTGTAVGGPSPQELDDLLDGALKATFPASDPISLSFDRPAAPKLEEQKIMAQTDLPRTVRLPTGRTMPVFGQGTVRMGEDRGKRKAEVVALRLGMDLGLTLIDTAEMYGEGGAEDVIGEAIAGRRDDVFVNSKVYPHNATRKGAVAACERSLKRLKTDYLDLYLLHWRGSVPLTETLEAFQSLKRAGKIRDYGVSNFDRADMEELNTLSGGDQIATNQVFYNLQHREIEWDLLPWCRERGLPVMAYSPIDEGKLAKHPGLKPVASRHGVTPAQVALAWLLRQDGIIVFPKASEQAHVQENRGALDLALTDDDLEELDQAFPPPRKKMALQTR